MVDLMLDFQIHNSSTFEIVTVDATNPLYNTRPYTSCSAPIIGNKTNQGVFIGIRFTIVNVANNTNIPENLIVTGIYRMNILTENGTLFSIDSNEQIEAYTNLLIYLYKTFNEEALKDPRIKSNHVPLSTFRKMAEDLKYNGEI